jgi:hypothetical protein
MKNSHALNKDLKFGTSHEFCWRADIANAVDAQERGTDQRLHEDHMSFFYLLCLDEARRHILYGLQL